MRKLANQGFTARALESWRSIIQDTTDRLLDRVQDQHSMDIVADLSVPLPALIIADIFGVPEQDRGNLIEWASDIGTFWGAPATDNIEAVARKADSSAVLFTELMQRIIADRRHNLGVVALGLGAANHDPEKFTSPETFDIMRSPNEHIGFGQGVHFCLGAVLARMELSICFATLLRRMPNIRFDPERPAVLKHTSLVFKGFETLAVKF